METSQVAYYAARAGEYERIYAKPERQAELDQLRSIIVDEFAGADVLEVACGTGYWTEVLARSAASVLATDASEEVLAIARAKKLDARKVSFRKADAYRLPSGGRPFSAGLAAFWWSHVPRARIQEFLRGFHRALGARAKVLFIDNVFVEGSSTPISRTSLDGDSYQIRKLADGSMHEVRKNFPSKTELCAAVGGLGSDVRCRFLRYYWTLSYVSQAAD